jgi:hypothetical protein
MKVQFTKNGRGDYNSLPPHIQALADKQFDLLVNIGIPHNSLHAKKYSETDATGMRGSRETGVFTFL